MSENVSVVIPCYGRHESTRLTLQSLSACRGSFEVVLVDDATPIPLAGVVAEFEDRLDIRYLRLPDNAGPSAARNAGVAAARHDVIVFTDNDCEVHPMWVVELSRYLRDATGNVAGVGGRVLAAGDDIYSRYFTYHKILDPFLCDGRYLYLVTANAAFRRSALEKVGGFDESITTPGGEDPGLCFKLLDAGFQLHYRPEAVVWHHYRMGLLDAARTFFRYGRGCRHQVAARAVNGDLMSPPERATHPP